jgi:hypothetical protein
MTLLEEPPTTVNPQEAQLLFKEARQRRRRLRMVRSIFVVAVVAAAVVLAFELHVISGPGSRSHPLDSQPPPASGNHSGATLVYAYSDLRVMNADTGASRSLPLPAHQGGSSDLSMVRIGSSLLLNRGNTAWLYGSGLNGPPVNLGPSLRVIPGPTANEAWIWSDPCGATVGCSSDDDGLQQGELRLVDSSGNQVGSPISLPADATWFPTGDVVNAGLVLAVASIGPDAEEIWNPITNHVVRILHGADVLASSGDLVAWTTGKACLPLCTVHFTDVQTGFQQTLHLPSDVTSTDRGAFSPNGSTFALPVGIGGSPGTHPGAVALMDLRTQAVRVLPGTEQALGPTYGPQVVFWSSRGWLFVAVAGGTHVLSWQPGYQRATVLSKVRLPPLSLNPPQFQTEYPTLIAM